MGLINQSRFWRLQESGLTQLMPDPTISIELVNVGTEETPVGTSLTGLLQGLDTYYMFPEVTNDLAEI